MLVQFATTFVVSLFATSYVARTVLLYLIGLGSLAAFAPFLVAAHRFIARGEVATISDAATVPPRVASFTNWLFALTITAYVVVARTAILLAAVANDAPGVTIGNALADTRGNATYIVLATFLCGIPFAIAVMLSFLGLSLLPMGARLFAIYFLLTVTAFIGLTLGSCIGARIYQAMGNRLNEARS